MELTTQTSSTPQLAASPDRALLKATANVVKVLFLHFPQLAASSTDQKQMVVEWAKGLQDMTAEEVERGLAACRARKFAPSLGEFAQLCRPWLDPEVAFLQAGKGLAARSAGEVGEWGHPGIWRAACTLSPEVRAGNYALVRKRWEMELAAELAAGWQEDVPAPLARIEYTPPEDVAMPPAVRRKLAAMFRSSPITQESVS